MTTNRELDEILAEIGREHRAVSPPLRLESTLRAAAEKRKKSPAIGKLAVSWPWAAAAAAIVAVATVGTIWQMRKRPQPATQQAQSAPVPQVGAEAPLPPRVVVGTDRTNHFVKGHDLVRAENGPVKLRALAPESMRAGRAESIRAGQGGSSESQPGWTSLDEFVPLPVSEGLAPAADLSVVRVKLRGSDLQQYGLEAPADAAQIMSAEFVVGEDGLPRAIRIVR